MWPGSEAGHLQPLGVEVRKRGSVNPLPLHALIECPGTNLPITHQQLSLVFFFGGGGRGGGGVKLLFLYL